MTQVVTGFIESVAEGKGGSMGALWRQICSLMRNTQQGVRIVAYIPQSREQQRIYHSALNDLATHVEIDGQRHSAAVWKRYTLAAFFQDTRDMPEFREEWRALGGLLIQGQLITTVTSADFSKALASAYLTFLHALGDENGVVWSVTSLGREAANDSSADGARRAA